MLSLVLIGLLAPDVDARQDLEKILARADQLLEEAKKGYEDARTRNAVGSFVEAAFVLEEARIKYLVLMEIGPEGMQKTAGERLRAVQQLSKLINDGRVAVGKARAPDAPPAAPEPPPVAPATPAAPPPPVVRPDADALRRLPLPDAAAVQQAEKIVRDLFKDQFAKKSAADQKELARLLLDQAAKMSDDSVGLYVLYRAAVQAALQGADLSSALFAVGELSRLFDVDGPALRRSTLAAASSTLKSPAELAELATAWLQSSYESATADEYELAEKAVAAALAAARKAADEALVQRVTIRGKEIAEAKSRFKALSGHLATLARTPEHPEANLEMGQFLCYVKGDWELGLRFLALGKDAVLKALAEREIARPASAQDLSSLADQWAQLSEKEKSPLRKGQMAAHARSLYEAALPSSTGLLRAAIEKKLSAGALAQKSEGRPGKPWIAIFDGRSLSCLSDVCKPGWKVQAGALCKIPASDLAAQTKDDFEDGEFRFRFDPRNLTQLKLSVHQGAQGSDAVMLDAAQLRDLQGKEHEVVFEVRGSDVKAALDGKPLSLFERSSATKGRVHIWAQGEGLRLLAIEYRPLK